MKSNFRPFLKKPHFKNNSSLKHKVQNILDFLIRELSQYYIWLFTYTNKYAIQIISIQFHFTGDAPAAINHRAGAVLLMCPFV